MIAAELESHQIYVSQTWHNVVGKVITQLCFPFPNTFTFTFLKSLTLFDFFTLSKSFAKSFKLKVVMVVLDQIMLDHAQIIAAIFKRISEKLFCICKLYISNLDEKTQFIISLERVSFTLKNLIAKLWMIPWPIVK